jgi:hypothetical protein
MPTYIDTIICEDIRSEVGNKVTLAGVFGEDMIVSQIPCVIPSFAIMQRWRLSNDEVARGGPGTFAVELQFPQGHANRFPAPINPVQPGPNVTTISFIFKFLNMTFPQQGEYRFRTYLNDREANVYRFYVTPGNIAGQPARPPIGFHPNQ